MLSRKDFCYSSLFLAWTFSLLATWVEAMEYYSLIGTTKAAGPTVGTNIDVLSTNLRTGSTPTMFVADRGSKMYRVAQLQITPGSPSTVTYNFIMSQTFTSLAGSLVVTISEPDGTSPLRPLRNDLRIPVGTGILLRVGPCHQVRCRRGNSDLCVPDRYRRFFVHGDRHHKHQGRDCAKTPLARQNSIHRSFPKLRSRLERLELQVFDLFAE